jgi:hypothetical protein
MSTLYVVAFALDFQLMRGRLARDHLSNWLTWRILLAPLQDSLSQPCPR